MDIESRTRRPLGESIRAPPMSSWEGARGSLVVAAEEEEEEVGDGRDS